MLPTTGERKANRQTNIARETCDPLFAVGRTYWTGLSRPFTGRSGRQGQIDTLKGYRVSFMVSQSLLYEEQQRVTVIADKPSSALSRCGIDFDAVYNEHVPLMIGLAVDRFHISQTDAQTLAHQIFLTYFLKPDDVRDQRAWFVGAICNAARHYLRMRERDVTLPPEFVNEPDPEFASILNSLPNKLAARQAFACLTSRCQLALQLHYLEGYTIPEIAAQLHISPTYAKKLVTRCLKQARERYR
jgi:RNA polymerase sigma factor (sigma-70 family)